MPATYYGDTLFRQSGFEELEQVRAETTFIDL